MVVVGVLADTHGWLDRHVCTELRCAQVSQILHAGDITDGAKSRLRLPCLLNKLAELAPVTAVRGNVDDKYVPGHGLPATASVEICGVRFFMHHGDEITSDDSALEQLCPAGG